MRWAKSREPESSPFSDLLLEERHRYRSARPPFVLNNRCRPLPTSRTFLIQDDEDVPDTPIEVRVEDWSERDFYCTAVIDGQRKLLKRVSDRAGHHVFGEWTTILTLHGQRWPTVLHQRLQRLHQLPECRPK